VAHAVIGGLVLATVNNGLGLLDQPAAVVNIITGLVLLLAASVDALSRRRASVATR
jgi:D-xylose transport system permease protein